MTAKKTFCLLLILGCLTAMTIARPSGSEVSDTTPAADQDVEPVSNEPVEEAETENTVLPNLDNLVSNWKSKGLGQDIL